MCIFNSLFKPLMPNKVLHLAVNWLFMVQFANETVHINTHYIASGKNQCQLLVAIGAKN